MFACVHCDLLASTTEAGEERVGQGPTHDKKFAINTRLGIIVSEMAIIHQLTRRSNGVSAPHSTKNRENGLNTRCRNRSDGILNAVGPPYGSLSQGCIDQSQFEVLPT